MWEEVNKKARKSMKETNRLMARAVEFEAQGMGEYADQLEKSIDLAMQRMERYDNFLSRWPISDR
jgi:hypothetical protein